MLLILSVESWRDSQITQTVVHFSSVSLFLLSSHGVSNILHDHGLCRQTKFNYAFVFTPLFDRAVIFWPNPTKPRVFLCRTELYRKRLINVALDLEGTIYRKTLFPEKEDFLCQIQKFVVSIKLKKCCRIETNLSWTVEPEPFNLDNLENDRN